VTAAEVFRRILGAVESAGIPYMLTGSFASSYHGAPRATQAAPEFYMEGRRLLTKASRQARLGGIL
jgi:hypothetical protein